MVNDVMSHNVTEKLYAVGTQKNVIYEIDPSNDWKVKYVYKRQRYGLYQRTFYLV